MDKIRNYYYLIAGAVAGFLPLLEFFKVITSDQAVTLTNLTDNLGSLLGGSAALTAGWVLSRQRKDGILEPAAEVSPVDAVLDNLPVVFDRVNKAAADLELVKTKTAEVFGNLPVYGAEIESLLKGLKI